MSFEGSRSEERYNQIWNTSAVRHDYRFECLTKQGLFFKRPTEEFLEIVLDYYNSVITFYMNVPRRCAEFEDREYIINYMKLTKDVAVSDLKRYKDFTTTNDKFGGYNHLITDYIHHIEAIHEKFVKQEAEKAIRIDAPCSRP